jgi:hypothetical protein
MCIHTKSLVRMARVVSLVTRSVGVKERTKVERLLLDKMNFLEFEAELLGIEFPYCSMCKEARPSLVPPRE